MGLFPVAAHRAIHQRLIGTRSANPRKSCGAFARASFIPPLNSRGCPGPYPLVNNNGGVQGPVSDTRLSFKEMCAKFDVTPRTLRYYEYIELAAARERKAGHVGITRAKLRG